jgi:hypothetical protein
MRYFQCGTGLLLTLTGILHVLPFFGVLQESHALVMLAFGIIYFTIGILLMRDVKSSNLLGIIFPFIGLVGGYLIFSPENIDLLTGILLAIDIVIVICCAALLSANRNSSSRRAG